MCKLTKKSKRKSFTGYKSVVKVGKKFYSPVTGMEYKVGPVPKIRGIGKHVLPGYMNVWRYLNGDFALDEDLAREYTRDSYDRSKHKPGVAMSHLSVMRGVAAKLEERAGDMGQIHVPTLVIHGEKDYLVPPRRGGEATSQGIPGAKLEIIPDMGHMLFNRELEERLVSLIADLMGSVPKEAS